MKKILTSIIACMISISMTAQLSILFVDDTDDTFMNAESFAAALDSLDYEYTYYDAVTEGSTPDAETLSNFDLIIWTTGSDQDDLQLWNGTGEDNQALIDYLLQGGNLWLAGLDFLFNRYPSAPDTFQVGDFPYDYLGITEYVGQTREDDGGDGVEIIAPVENSSIPDLNPLDFIFSTLWYADAVEIKEEAEAVYMMSNADDNYPYNGKTAGLLYETENFTTLTYLFNMGIVSSTDKIITSVEAVMNYFEGKTTSISTFKPSTRDFYITPNPASETILLKNLKVTEDQKISIFNALGEKVRFIPGGTNTVDISKLPCGQYYLILDDREERTAKKFVKL